MFSRKKVYGESRFEGCPFCGKQSTTTNKQGFPVCRDHADAVMNDMRCACGDYLDIKKGKYGIFFLCMHCGPISLSKAFGINEIKDVSKGAKESAEPIQKTQQKAAPPREITITSDDPNYF